MSTPFDQSIDSRSLEPSPKLPVLRFVVLAQRGDPTAPADPGVGVELYPGEVLAGVVTEDGEVIDQHMCSSIAWAKQDLRRPYHLAIYAARYPDGYTIVDELGS